MKKHPDSWPVSKKEAFTHLLKIGRWALRAKYSPTECRQIERAFRDDPAEIISIAARDLENAVKSERRAKSGGRISK